MAFRSRVSITMVFFLVIIASVIFLVFYLKNNLLPNPS
jgi:hypothetical protein